MPDEVQPVGVADAVNAEETGTQNIDAVDPEESAQVPRLSLDSIRQSLKSIVVEPREQLEFVRPGQPFDPRLRDKIADAQREQQLQEYGEHAVLSRGQDFAVERWGNRCWRVPADWGEGPFDQRIIQFELDCPSMNAGQFELVPDGTKRDAMHELQGPR